MVLCSSVQHLFFSGIQFIKALLYLLILIIILENNIYFIHFVDDVVLIMIWKEIFGYSPYKLEVEVN